MEWYFMQVCMTRSDPGAVQLHSVGCTAEIRQIKRQDDGVLNIVAKGTLNDDHVEDSAHCACIPQ